MAIVQRKRPRDPVQFAKLIGDIATGQVEDRVETGKSPAAVELGRLGGAKGGKARAKTLSPTKRKAIAKEGGTGAVGEVTKTATRSAQPELVPFLRRDSKARPVFTTRHGALFEGDCLSVLPQFADACVDTVFADPPFNLGKEYGNGVNDRRADQEYLAWCRSWIDECVRILKPGGAFFLYNLPRWNVELGHYLMRSGMQFRHWIAINIKFGLPIAGRLYPSHYSLIYCTKGKAKTFRRIRTPIETCRHCGGEIKDYGGHRGAMNPAGVNLTDVWNDIPPVRHWKFKSKKRRANALSTKVLDRVVEMTTIPGELVCDPFGGSGTTYAVCERKCRRWLGIELESVDVIMERLTGGDLHYHPTRDFVEDGLPKVASASLPRSRPCVVSPTRLRHRRALGQ